MPVYPESFNNPANSANVVCDEMGHTGTLTMEQMPYAKNMDDTDNRNSLSIECPDGCGMTTSTHPVGGGSHPLQVQELFVRKEVSLGVPPQQAIDDVKARVIASDGEGRWQVDEQKLLEELT
jgi:hypothetical protein